jgi:hypothetical protein
VTGTGETLQSYDRVCSLSSSLLMVTEGSRDFPSEVTGTGETLLARNKRNARGSVGEMGVTGAGELLRPRNRANARGSVGEIGETGSGDCTSLISLLGMHC